MSNRFITVLRQSGARVFITGGVVIILLIILGYIGNAIDFEERFRGLPFSMEGNVAWYQGPLGYWLLGTAVICVGCPRQVVSFFAAYFFGIWFGLGIALAATVSGCIVSVAVARIFQTTFRKIVRGKVEVAVQFWKDNAFFATIIMRFMPAGSNLLTNFAAGALGIPVFSFVVGSAVGYIPQTLIFAIVGSGVKVESGVQLGVSVALFILSAVMGLLLYAKYRNTLRGNP